MGEQMEKWGLIFNTIGVLVLAIAQNKLDGMVRFWLDALDFSIETILSPSHAPSVRISGMDEQMKRVLTTNRWLSTAGWAISAVGFVLQLVR
jgi:hypothetical protein